MKKPKRKLSEAEKAEKRRRRKEYLTIFVHGKQERGKRPPTIEGLDADEFIRRNADPIRLHQNEMWSNHCSIFHQRFRCFSRRIKGGSYPIDRVKGHRSGERQG